MKRGWSLEKIRPSSSIEMCGLSLNYKLTRLTCLHLRTIFLNAFG